MIHRDSAWHNFWVRLRAFLTSQGTHVILFLAVNVVLGALGILVPLAIEYTATDSFIPALKKQLDAASAYTFSIAFLASCVSLVVAEYLDRKEIAQYRSLKVVLSLCAGLMMVFCAVFSGSQAARALIGEHGQIQPSKTEISQVEAKATVSTALVEGRLSASAAPKVASDQELTLTPLDKLQVKTTVAAVIVGLLLFLVFQYQAPSMTEQLAKYGRKTDEDVEVLTREQSYPEIRCSAR
jgi:hypothetical protein